MKHLSYKGYTGSVEWDEDDQMFFGTVQGIRDTVMYAGYTEEELGFDFEAAVDMYFEHCQQLGREPNIPNVDVSNNK